MTENGLEHLSADGILATIGEQEMEGQIAFRIAAQIDDTLKRDVDRKNPEIARSHARFDRKFRSLP